MKPEDFKIGDNIIIKKRPRYWSSQLSNKDPLSTGKNPVAYPYSCKIIKISNGNFHWSIEDSNEYGWDLECLIDEKCIYNIRKERALKLKKLYR